MNFVRRQPAGWLSCLWGSMMLTLVTGCHADHRQSILHPASPPAQQIAWLWWFLLATCTMVFILVMIMTWLAVRPQANASSTPTHSGQESTSTESQNSKHGLGDKFIIWLGAIIPAVILIVILLLSVSTQKALRQPETKLTIEVVGHQFWWEVHYPEQGFEIANEIRIPVGEPVRLELISADVTHSLWIPSLQGKSDLLPDRVNVAWIQANQAGDYRGQCAEYCGVQHALMALEIVAVSRQEFDQWISERQQPFKASTEPLQQRGQDVFVKSNCNTCHTIGDRPAAQKRGPDLTHFGDRRTIAAGLLPNTPENVMRWIKDPQGLKPGNLMPKTEVSDDDLHALVEYLKSLK